MNISELSNCNVGKFITFNCILGQKLTCSKNGGGSYLNITLVDKTGRISFPVFDDVEENESNLVEGSAYSVSAIINKWNGNTQLKNAKFELLEDDAYTADDFIDSYSILEKINRFEKIIDTLEYPYDVFIKHAIGLDGNKSTWDKFTKCPSAEKYHGNKLSGLFLHTLGVTENVINIYNLYARNIKEYGYVKSVININRLVAKAIFHDIMKINEYEYNTFIKRIPGVVGHIYDGIGYADKINEECGFILNREQIEEIKNCVLTHHGQYGPKEPDNLEDQLIHLADMIDAKVVGEIESNKE